MNKKLLEQIIKVDTEGREVFTLFECCILLLQGKWNRQYDIAASGFDKVTSEGNILFRFISDNDILGELGINSLQIDAIRDWDVTNSEGYFMLTYAEAEEHFLSGRVLPLLDDETIDRLVELVTLYDPFEYSGLSDMDKPSQCRVIETFLEQTQIEIDGEEDGLMQDIINEYLTYADDAYVNEMKDAMTKQFFSPLKEFGIHATSFSRIRFYSWSLDFRTFLVKVAKEKLSRKIDFLEYFQKAAELTGVDFYTDIHEMKVESMKLDHLDKKGLNRDCLTHINRVIENLSSEDRKERLQKRHDEIRELTRLGFNLAGYNKTPDGKFLIKVNHRNDEEGTYDIALYNIKKTKKIYATIPFSRLLSLYTHPTLFPAKDMLREGKELSYGSDRDRLTLLEQATEEQVNHSPTLQEDLLGDQTLLIKKRSQTLIEYNELWNDSSLDALRSKPGYENLSHEAALSKFSSERLQEVSKRLGYKTQRVSINPLYNYDNMEKDYWLKVYLRKCSL